VAVEGVGGVHDRGVGGISWSSLFYAWLRQERGAGGCSGRDVCQAFGDGTGRGVRRLRGGSVVIAGLRVGLVALPGDCRATVEVFDCSCSLCGGGMGFRVSLMNVIEALGNV